MSLFVGGRGVLVSTYLSEVVLDNFFGTSYFIPLFSEMIDVQDLLKQTFFSFCWHILSFGDGQQAGCELDVHDSHLCVIGCVFDWAGGKASES